MKLGSLKRGLLRFYCSEIQSYLQIKNLLRNEVLENYNKTVNKHARDNATLQLGQTI